MDISIIEFGVYGFITYSSLLMLIISTIKEVPATKSLSITRAIYLIPGIICAMLLASSGVNITLEDTTNTITLDFEALNSTDNNIVTLNSTQTTTETNQIVLLNPVWVILHFLIAAVLVVYVINQMLTLFTKI
mgnify:CR=1 FL=1